jgi:NAD(P)H-dependent FMN reductase
MTTGIIVGNPKPQSRTYHAAVTVVRELTGHDPDFRIDLVEFGPALLDWSDPFVSAAVDQVKAARLVVVASPTFKATYTGLLKIFRGRLAGGRRRDTPATRRQLATFVGTGGIPQARPGRNRRLHTHPRALPPRFRCG